MYDLFIKIVKFIGFLIWVGALILLFVAFGWIGLIAGLVVSGGARLIFGNDD